MRFVHRDAVAADLPKIVEIYNFAVATRESSCDLEPTTVAARRESFSQHSPGHRPIWVAEDADAPEQGVVGYLGFFHFMNERPGYYITADLAIYLHPDYQNRRLGTYLLSEAIRHASSLGIEVLAVTIFASNQASIELFTRHGFERWGYMPRVARLENTERDLVMMGRRLN
ncbi:MAG: N-acetyltransferase family protein [Steroidobacteraceae bacterium]